MRSCWIASLAFIFLYACSARAENCPSPGSGSFSDAAQCKVDSLPISLKGWTIAKWREKDGKYYYAVFNGTNRTAEDRDFQATRTRSFSELKFKLKEFHEGESVATFDPKNARIHAPNFTLGKPVYFSKYELRQLGELLKQKKIEFKN